MKIISGYYRNMLLSQQLLHVMRNVSGNFFFFQQVDQRTRNRCFHSSRSATVKWYRP